MLPPGDSPMEWMLRLVGMGHDGQSRSFDVMEISRPDDLGDIADLGMTLSEAKQLLGQVQRQVVAMPMRSCEPGQIVLMSALGASFVRRSRADAPEFSNSSHPSVWTHQDVRDRPQPCTGTVSPHPPVP